MNKFHPFGSTTFTLGQSISSTDSSIILTSFVEPVTGIPYTMALLNTDIAYGTIAPKTTASEFISFTGITQNANGTATLTGVVRGLAKKYPFTTDAAYKLPHSGQTQFIISDMPQIFEEYISLTDDVTVTGIKTFSSSPIVPTGGTGTQVANATDIANAISGASGTATDSIFGTVKLSVAAASVPNPIVVGDNDTRVPTQGENDALVGTSGTAVSGSNKLVDAADATTAKTANKIARRDSNGDVLVSTTPTSGDAAASKTYVDAIKSIFKSGVSVAPTSAGTQTIAHGLGVTPKRVKILAQTYSSGYNFPNTQVQSTGTYDGTNTSTIAYHVDHVGSGYGTGASISTDTINIIFIRTYYDDYSGNSNSSSARISVDATNITLTWSTGTSGAGAFPFMWEAEV
jgi:hypothetical protein